MSQRYNVRADELRPGDVLAEEFLRYRRVLTVHQFNGWVGVRFDPVGSVAFDNDRRMELVAADPDCIYGMALREKADPQ